MSIGLHIHETRRVYRARQSLASWTECINCAYSYIPHVQHIIHDTVCAAGCRNLHCVPVLASLALCSSSPVPVS